MMSDDTVIALKGIYRAHGDENHYGRVARQSLEMILALQAEVERLHGIIDRLHTHAIRHWVKKDQFYHMIEFIAIVDEAKDEGREVQ
jgi:hypothetical protein